MKKRGNISFSKVISRVAVLLLAVGLSFSSAYAQKKAVREALQALQIEDLTTAKAYIDSASVHPETKDSSSTWYYRGFVYKKLYNNQEKSNKQSKSREIAIESFTTFFKLDKKSELFETAEKSMKYLASTLYNDAATSLNATEYQLAIANFEKYKNTMSIIDPNHNFRSLEMQFHLVLGQVYNQMYEQDREANKSFYQKTQDAYLVVLNLDSNNISANYNIAILFYNEGVNIIKNLDYDLDLITLTLIQDEVVVLFQKALPYAKKAYKLNHCRKETLIMLSGIYFSLNEMDKSEEIQKELEALEYVDEYKALKNKLKILENTSDEFKEAQSKIQNLEKKYVNIKVCAGY